MLCLETALGDGEVVRGRFALSLFLGTWSATLSEPMPFSLEIRTSHCHFDFACPNVCLSHPHYFWSRPCSPRLRVGSILLRRKQHPGCSLLIAAWRVRRHSRCSGIWDLWNAVIYLSMRHERTDRGTGPPRARLDRLGLLALQVRQVRQVPQVPWGPGPGSGPGPELELELELGFGFEEEEEGVVVVAAELALVQQEGR